MRVWAHRVAGQVLAAREEPIDRVEPAEPTREQIKKFGGKGFGLQPVRAQKVELKTERLRVSGTEYQIRDGKQKQHSQARQQMPALLPMIRPVQKQQEEKTNNHYGLKRGVAVKTKPGRNDGPGHGLGLFEPVVEICVQSSGKQGSPQAGFECGTRVQKPGWYRTEQKWHQPPAAQFKELAHGQAA